MARKKEYYNNWVDAKPISISLPLINLFHRRMLKKAEEIINNLRSMKILEIGVGFGYFARTVKKLGCKYFGIEMNERLALSLKNDGFNVTCGVVPPFPNDPEIGVIWLSHVIEHCSTYLEARDFIEKAYLALKPGGYIVIISPDILSWKTEFWNVDWSHSFPTSLRNCSQILNDAGFSIVFQSYHTATIFQPIIQFIINLVFRLIPYRFLDFIISPFTKRPLFYAFMTLFGWRQIYLVGKK
jgi:SAM-dependent methyltransferase